MYGARPSQRHFAAFISGCSCKTTYSFLIWRAVARRAGLETTALIKIFVDRRSVGRISPLFEPFERKRAGIPWTRLGNDAPGLGQPHLSARAVPTSGAGLHKYRLSTAPHRGI